MPKTYDAAKIRNLNDRFRATFHGGRVMMTQGVQQLRGEALERLIGAVQGFDGFTTGNDPHGEHDFGSVEVDGERFFWKIDYYDLAMSQHSADPADPEATIRVLTLMRADEY
jgi:hypothetical protein